MNDRIIFEIETSSKPGIIPMKNFPFKELLEENFQKIQKEKEEKDENDLESASEFDSDEELELFDLDIKNIDDLINLGEKYDKDDKKKYAINLKRLNQMIVPLKELKETVGMEEVKSSIIKQIIYILQKFDKESEMLHTVIEGPPGVGKTMLGQIIGNIYYTMGILKKGKKTIKKQEHPLFSLFGMSEEIKSQPSINTSPYPFKIVKRADLIGQYLGHTAQKTQNAIDEAQGGILFIDEAYSLGSDELKDSYAKECIDTLNQNLSENKCNFVCIIAGYSKELDKYFFSQNRGLERRFPFKYCIEKYNSDELVKILEMKIKKNKWKIDQNFKNYNKELVKLINENIENFNNFGGDIETYFFKCKIAHSMRVFGKHPKERKKLNKEDFENGLKTFIENKRNKDQNEKSIMNSMYV